MLKYDWLLRLYHSHKTVKVGAVKVERTRTTRTFSVSKKAGELHLKSPVLPYFYDSGRAFQKLYGNRPLDRFIEASVWSIYGGMLKMILRAIFVTHFH